MKFILSLFAALVLTSVSHASCNSDIESTVRKQAEKDLGFSNFTLGDIDIFAGVSVQVDQVSIYQTPTIDKADEPGDLLAQYEVQVETNDDVSTTQLSQNCSIIRTTRVK